MNPSTTAGAALVLGQHLVGAADLVSFQAVEEGDAHHGRCREQTPGQHNISGIFSLIPGDQPPLLERRSGMQSTLSTVSSSGCLCIPKRFPSKPPRTSSGSCTALKGR